MEQLPAANGFAYTDLHLLDSAADVNRVTALDALMILQGWLGGMIEL